MSRKAIMNLDSPLFSIKADENSPMTNLANNLGNTNISVRRRLSLSNIDSPCDSSESSMVSPIKSISSKQRLFKTTQRFNNSNTSLGNATTGNRSIFARRLAHMGDENINPIETSPIKPNVSPSKFLAVSQVTNPKTRQPLEDHDTNSLDSGYCQSDDSKSTSSDFAFVQPCGLAPRRSTVESPQSTHLSSSCNESSDDGFNDFILPLQDEEAQLPPGLGGLITDPIINQGLSAESSHFINFRQCISDNNLSPTGDEHGKKRASTTPLDITPVSKRLKSSQETPNTPNSRQHTLFQYGFKRLAEPRPLLSHSLSLEEPINPIPRPKFRHCLSESEAVIKRALHRSTEEELIGDFTKSYALPLVDGSHQDLKSISPATLASLINGKFSDVIASYQIIDCRYPYEYDGGHIRGAQNLYTRDQVIKQLIANKKSPEASLAGSGKRHIVIFHCEFSSERGPGLSRFLRSKDREANAYPSLNHPELYLLEGGYKAFFLAHQDLCEPCAYRKMIDADEGQIQHFRAKTKTWSGDKSNRIIKRSTSFKRLGL